MSNAVRGNPLRTRADVSSAAAEILSPLIPLMSAGRSHIHLDDTGAVYPRAIADMEAFARPLWAILPMMMGKCPEVEPFWSCWRKGIRNGVNPNHPEYWGIVGDFDQRLVEMAVFGMGMCLCPDLFFFKLPKKTQNQLHQWLKQINDHEIPKNNWVFFRVLVNTGFRVCGLPYSQNRLNEDFALIEAHYEGEGWYCDYQTQHDYYTFWAFHFYGLVYSMAMKDLDPERANTYRERAVQVARDFACWFDAAGSALPYGRSLTYRFAQSAFFAAAAYAGAVSDEVDYGVLKHLVLNNLRYWMRKPIFTRDGILSIGYGYPNLIMAEGYNAPGSPYWAMKTFLCLALPENHPFWTAEEKPFKGPDRCLQKHAGMLLCRSENGSQVLAYPAGNHAPEHAHDEAKYEKFVYSTVYGFSVPKASKNLWDGAFDNTLAISPDGTAYQSRYGCKSYQISLNSVCSVWSPFPGITVKSEIIPLRENWHMRMHTIICKRKVWVAEGGFAIARDGACEGTVTEKETEASFCSPWGVSAVFGLQGYKQGKVVGAEPNTNLMANRTYIPTLTVELAAGTHRLTCAVYGSPDSAMVPEWPQEVKQYARLG